MKDDEKTEHLPAHKATLMRPSPHATPASPPAPPAKDDEQTVMRAPTEMAAPTAVDPDATKKTLRPEVPATAARTLQAAPPTAQSAYAQDVAHSRAGSRVRANIAGAIGPTHRSGWHAGAVESPGRLARRRGRRPSRSARAGLDHQEALRPREAAGQGRHGPGVRRHRSPQGRSARSESTRRTQGAERGFPAPSASVHGSAARGAQSADARASERRHGVRLRSRRRCRVHDDGAAGRARARLDDARSARQGHQARRCAADHSRHRRRSGVRAPQGHRAFRPEARQRLHHRRTTPRRFSTSASRAQCRA